MHPLAEEISETSLMLSTPSMLDEVDKYPSLEEQTFQEITRSLSVM